ncbi:MAG: FtsX-like permease family protein, partial [Terriglobia bacterium]
GLMMSAWGISLLRAGLGFNFYGKQMAAGIHLDHPTLLFTMIVSLGAAMLAGLTPAVRATKISLTGALNEGGRSGSAGLARSRLRSVLVAGEIALAVTLLAGAGVIMRELVREITQNEGFNLNHVLKAGIHLDGRNYQSPAAQALFFQRVTEKLRQLPGVQSASATSSVPLEGSASESFSVDGQPPLPQSKRPFADYFVVGLGYFRTMEIPLVRGREFADSDNASAPVVALVNREFARRFFPGGKGAGHRVKVDTKHPVWAEIVGVVGNVNDYGGQLAPHPQIYESYLQAPTPDMSLVVRSQAAPAALAPMLRQAVWSVDKDQPIGDLTGGVLTMEEVANEDLGGAKLMVALLGIFAPLALILAAVGIYGVIAFSVGQRTHEIGIRMALGAREGDVLRLVLRQGGLLTAIGCAIGLAPALPLPKLLAGIFTGMAPQGPLAAIVVSVVVAAVSLLATYVPARRAANIDPMVALRNE